MKTIVLMQKYFLCLSIYLVLGNYLSGQHQIGVNLNTIRLDGDVDPNHLIFNGIGLTYQARLSPLLGLQVEVDFGNTDGINLRTYEHSTRGGGLVEEYYAPYAEANVFHPNYSLQVFKLGIESCFYPFGRPDRGLLKAISPYITAGMGYIRHRTNLNLLDRNKEPYQFSEVDRTTDIKEILQKFDETNETRINPEDQSSMYWSLGLGTSLYNTNVWNFQFTFDLLYTGRDDLDGITYRTATEKTGNNDILQFYSFKIFRSLNH